MTLGFALFPTEIGPCGIAWGAHGVTGVQLPEADEAATRARMHHRFGPPEAEPPAQAIAWIHAIQAHLSGKHDDLTQIPLDMGAVPEFHRRVYEIARAIPPGRTLTYGEVAVLAGSPGAARAVGQALARNPFAPVVPCHRILAAGAKPGGFSAGGGVATKLRLLAIEGADGVQSGLF